MEEALQQIVNCFSDAAFGLFSSLKKTEILQQSPPRKAYNAPQIGIDRTNLNAVEHVTYLCRDISTDATVSKVR